MKLEFAWNFKDTGGFCHIIYDNGIVSVSDEEGMFIAFEIEESSLGDNLRDEEQIRLNLALDVGVMIGRVDTIRILHRELVKYGVHEYQWGKDAPLIRRGGYAGK